MYVIVASYRRKQFVSNGGDLKKKLWSCIPAEPILHFNTIPRRIPSGRNQVFLPFQT